MGLEQPLQGIGVVVDRAGREGDQVQAIAYFQPSAAELFEPVVLGGGVGRVKVRTG